MNIPKILSARAKDHKEKPAFIFKGQPISFFELKERVFKLAQGLSKLDIVRGDKVAIYLPGVPEYAISYLAIWCLGATAVPLDYMLTEEELVSCVSHSEAKALIIKEKEGVLASNIKRRFWRLESTILYTEKPSPEKSFGPLFFHELEAKATPEIPELIMQDNEYAIIFYTSGTTGKPKGVLINYLQLGVPPTAMEHFVDFGENDVALCALPFSHLGGLIYIQNCLSFALTVVLMERFIPVEFLKNIQQYKVSCFWIVPSMYYALLHLKEFEKFDLSSLRWMVTFGASNSPEALRRFHQYCPNAHLLNGWGMTETNAPTTVLPMGSQKIESVGRPAPWAQVKIIDEKDREVRKNEVGEIVVKGWMVTDGYYKDSQATKEAFKNGWFHTGDLGKFDDEGDLYIVGRKKEMIKVAGEIVFEPEVEASLYKHPDIAEAAVVGIADPLRGEVPKAFVVFKQGKSVSEEDLRYFLRQHLAHYKIPHAFEFCSELPKNRIGKVDKEKLRSLKPS